jgi:hypothetical protein
LLLDGLVLKGCSASIGRGTVGLNNDTRKKPIEEDTVDSSWRPKRKGRRDRAFLPCKNLLYVPFFLALVIRLSQDRKLTRTREDGLILNKGG